MSRTKLSNPTVVINNNAVPIIPNTFSFTEGFGEQELKVQSSGGGSVQTVLSNNVETNMSMVKFSIHNTAELIDLARSWKVNANKNAITVTGEGLTRAFNNAAVTNDYEVNLGADTTIDIEFKSDAAV